MRLALAGQKQAFGELAERYQSIAGRVARRMVGQEEIAQELVQEAMLQAFLSLSRLREPGSFKSWLLGIILNLCRNYLREQYGARRKPEKGPHLTGEELSALFSWPPDPQVVVEERELYELVLAAVNDLPVGQREAALMYYFGFLSLQEIAAVTGLSINAVKVRLHRARSGLREQIQKRYPEVRPVERQTAMKLKGRQAMIKVTVGDVVRHEDKVVVMLVDEEQERYLPIWIGEFEGGAIVMGLLDFPTGRPLTFSFIASLLNALGAQLTQVRIESLKGDTFYAVAQLQANEAVQEIDARPSDALALAVRTGSPIYVAEEVMERAGKRMDDGEVPASLGEGAEAILEEIKRHIQRPGSSAEPCE